MELVCAYGYPATYPDDTRDTVKRSFQNRGPAFPRTPQGGGHGGADEDGICALRVLLGARVAGAPDRERLGPFAPSPFLRLGSLLASTLNATGQSRVTLSLC